MRQLAALLFIMVLAVLAHAQPINLKGQLLPEQKARVQIQVYDDLVSYRLLTESQIYSANDGSFKLHFDPGYIKSGRITVNMLESEMIWVPGASYDMKIVLPEMQKGSYFDNLILSYDGHIDHDQQIIFDIERINEAYNEFVLSEFETIIRSRNHAAVDELQAKINSRLESSNSYPKQYLEYKMGFLQQVFLDKEEMTEKYFASKSILYNNIEYMSLLNETFQSYFMSRGKFNMDDIKLAIEQGNLQYFRDALIQDMGLDAQMTELLLLLGLRDLYQVKGLNKNKLSSMIQYLGDKTSFQEHKKIALNLLFQLQKLARGSQAPGFDFYSGDSLKNTSSLVGKITLLSFVRPECGVCHRDQLILDTLLAGFGHAVQQFILVDDRAQTDEWHTYASSHQSALGVPVDWFEVLDAYDIRLFPSYVLIDGQNKLLAAPAPNPEENLRHFIKNAL